jgi:hypothetical protein
LRRTIDNASGVSTIAIVAPTANHARRQPHACTSDPTTGKATMKPMLIATLYTAIARSMRRTNHCPTIARLMTESALWPQARVIVSASASAANDDTRLIRQTVTPRTAAMKARTTLLPKRSRTAPIPTAPTEPTSVAHRLSCAYSTRPIFKSASNGSVMSPNPCVRPGSVPTIAAAATHTTYQP